MSLNDYRNKYTQDGTGEDVPVGWTLWNRSTAAASGNQQNTANTQTNSGVQQNDPLALVQNHLTPAEQQVFRTRYEVLFYQADSDPALVSAIRDVVMGEINIARYQEQLAKVTRKFSQSINSANAAQAQALSKLIKDTQESNLKLMQSLAVTRADKQKQKKVIESTPSRYVSAYERIKKNFTEDQFKRAEQEELDAVARLTRKAPTFKAMAPTEPEPEKGADVGVDA